MLGSPMIRSILRALTVALLAASAATVALVLWYSPDATVAFEMDRELPARFARGLYPPERDGDYTFAWSAREATLAFPGLSRAVPWECTWRVRGARGGGLVQPTVQASIDGLIVATTTATNEQQELTAVAPGRRASDGLDAVDRRHVRRWFRVLPTAASSASRSTASPAARRAAPTSCRRGRCSARRHWRARSSGWRSPSAASRSAPPSSEPS